MKPIHWPPSEAYGLGFPSSDEIVSNINLEQFNMIYKLVQVSFILQFIFLIKTLMEKSYMMSISKTVKRYEHNIVSAIFFLLT